MFILKYIRVHLCLWDRCPDIPEETGSITIMPHDRINAINLHSLVVNHPFNGKTGPRSCKMPMAQHNRATRPLTEGIKLSAVSFILSALFTSKFHWDFRERERIEGTFVQAKWDPKLSIHVCLKVLGNESMNCLLTKLPNFPTYQGKLNAPKSIVELPDPLSIHVCFLFILICPLSVRLGIKH